MAADWGTDLSMLMQVGGAGAGAAVGGFDIGSIVAQIAGVGVVMAIVGQA